MLKVGLIQCPEFVDHYGRYGLRRGERYFEWKNNYFRLIELWGKVVNAQPEH
ncbi:hypothetical protein VCRA2121O67_230038 [Vibrio crassostreae]|nr:hypothetical protein VCRA2113O25_260038 [Vibrio crassostreae]CAK2774932.1 hypothetical protein VCRA2119O385_280036 [Vibrio crassostreae]CAK2816474.1 hypothetical protein VCRA2113O23_260038 [Vibrio crassostreae]CAK3363560.1 hypothetical protein VCRA2121O67_230038 [Vibrio crassostreae]CAK3528158.1 hypothetical protein VCRA2125O343_240040 [Vibrio crassostreae]